jgi:hypothetical protein
MVLKTYFPVKEIRLHLLNNPRRTNRISVTVEGRTRRIVLGSKERGTLVFPVGNGFQVREAHLYRIKIKAGKGSIPYYENRSSGERRYLGVFFEPELIPRS